MSSTGVMYTTSSQGQEESHCVNNLTFFVLILQLLMEFLVSYLALIYNIYPTNLVQQIDIYLIQCYLI